MRDTFRITARTVALFVSAWAFFNSSSVWAGYLPANFVDSRGNLFTSDTCAFDSSESNLCTSFAADAQPVQVEPVDFPGQPDCPNAHHSPWTFLSSLIVVRGHRSGTGTGGPVSGHDSGNQPIDCMFSHLALRCAEFNSALRESGCRAISFTSSRLFRPPAGVVVFALVEAFK